MAAAPLLVPGPKTYPSLSQFPGLRGPRDIRVTWGPVTVRGLAGVATTRTMSGHLTVEEN